MRQVGARKTARFTSYLSRQMRRLLIAIMPPVLAIPIRWLRGQLQQHRSWIRTSEDPAKYSTLDNPLEVPSQVESYLFCRDKYLRPTDTVLDVGFGLGYGLQIMAAKAKNLLGVEVDKDAVARSGRIFSGHPKVARILQYDGLRFPLEDKSIDVVTCIEILEHVEEYKNLLSEMTRVARRAVFITTPNRLPENTRRDGRPKNY